MAICCRCHHGAEGKCMNCVPLDPWDPSSLAAPIKHLSFHCYLRKLTSGVDRGKFLNLEDLRCKIRESCPDHPPWPAGICTKCQPSTITLTRQVGQTAPLTPLSPPPSLQPYRHVDHVMFDHPGIVDRFLDGWRRSGRQRIGFLLGKYEVYERVPLGIQAVVSAIYEPPQVSIHVPPTETALCTCLYMQYQESTSHSVELLEDSNESAMVELAGHLGLRMVRTN